MGTTVIHCTTTLKDAHINDKLTYILYIPISNTADQMTRLQKSTHFMKNV